MRILKDDHPFETQPDERGATPVLRPVAPTPCGPPAKDGSAVAGFFFLALLGFSVAVFSLESGQGATAASPSSVSAPDSQRDTLASGAAGPSKKFRKMEPSEEMGISLSVESRDAEVRREEGSLPSPSAEKAKARKAQTREVGAKKGLPERLEIKKSEPKDSPFAAFFEEADKRLEAKDWKGAVGSYNRVLKKDPKNETALRGKIYALDKNGSDKALELLDEMAEKHPRLAPLHAARARILVRQNDTMEALAAWKQALALDPKNEDYRLGLAVLNDRLGHEAEALSLYRELKGPLSSETKKRLDYLSSKASANR